MSQIDGSQANDKSRAGGAFGWTPPPGSTVVVGRGVTLRDARSATSEAAHDAPASVDDDADDDAEPSEAEE